MQTVCYSRIDGYAMGYQSSSRPPVISTSDHEIVVSECLFAWRGAGIVLMGERNEGAWVLARGWRSADRLTDIRRWVFADPAKFVGQVRRLVLEATENSSQAVNAANAAGGWIQLRLRDRANAS
jgi:hypothetical protein